MTNEESDSPKVAEMTDRAEDDERCLTDGDSNQDDREEPRSDEFSDRYGGYDKAEELQNAELPPDRELRGETDAARSPTEMQVIIDRLYYDLNQLHMLATEPGAERVHPAGIINRSRTDTTGGVRASNEEIEEMLTNAATERLIKSDEDAKRWADAQPDGPHPSEVNEE